MAPNDEVTELTNAATTWSLEEMLEPAAASSKNKNVMDWGYPGHLTKAELDVYVQFQKEVERRGGDFKNTVYSFSLEEGEPHALTRWLRARKYVYKDVIEMVEGATKERAGPSNEDFYPSPEEVLGVDPNILNSQYPQLYSGFSKSGCPVFYSKPGLLNIDGIECITTLDGFLKYHWHVMQHDYRKRLLEFKSKNPQFTNFQCVSILDLNKLSVSMLNSRTLDIIKKQSFIDSLCYPETMNKMIIVNAPRVFNVTWSLIKGWLDERTTNKVELYSSTSAAQKRLKELIDLDQLPSDYGGTAESTDETMVNSLTGGAGRIVTDVMAVRSSQSFKIDLKAGEECDLFVHTRAMIGANFKVTDVKKNPLAPQMNAKHSGTADVTEMPTRIHLTASGRISGPVIIRVKAESLGGGVMSTEKFLLVGRIYKK